LQKRSLPWPFEHLLACTPFEPSIVNTELTLQSIHSDHSDLRLPRMGNPGGQLPFEIAMSAKQTPLHH
jgi:hypothetical protein